MEHRQKREAICWMEGSNEKGVKHGSKKEQKNELLRVWRAAEEEGEAGMKADKG